MDAWSAPGLSLRDASIEDGFRFERRNFCDNVMMIECKIKECEGNSTIFLITAIARLKEGNT